MTCDGGCCSLCDGGGGGSGMSHNLCLPSWLYRNSIPSLLYPTSHTLSVSQDIAGTTTVRVLGASTLPPTKESHHNLVIQLNTKKSK